MKKGRASEAGSIQDAHPRDEGYARERSTLSQAAKNIAASYQHLFINSTTNGAVLESLLLFPIVILQPDFTTLFTYAPSGYRMHKR